MNVHPTTHDGDVLAWIDVETSGLSATDDYLLEVACILTDTNLDPLAEPFHRVIGWPETFVPIIKAATSEYVVDMHTKTGLWDKLPTGTDLTTVDNQLEEYIRAVAPEKRQARVAGNSVRLDLNFLEAYLPFTYNHLHYRFVDVTGIEYMLEQWNQADGLTSEDRNHDALSDIQASIEQLRHLKNQLEGI